MTSAALRQLLAARARQLRGQAFGVHYNTVLYYPEGGVKTQSGVYPVLRVTDWRANVGLVNDFHAGFPTSIKAAWQYYQEMPPDWWTQLNEALSLGCDIHLQFDEYNPQNPGPNVAHDSTPFATRVSTFIAHMDAQVSAENRSRIHLYYGNEPDLGAWNGTDEEWCDRQAEFAAAAIAAGYKWGVGQYANLGKQIELLPYLLTALANHGIVSHADGFLGCHIYGPGGDPLLVRRFRDGARKIGWTGGLIVNEQSYRVSSEDWPAAQVARWAYHFSHECAALGVSCCYFSILKAQLVPEVEVAVAEALRDTALNAGPRSYQYPYGNNQQTSAITSARIARMALDPSSEVWYASVAGQRAFADFMADYVERVKYTREHRKSDAR